MTTPGLPPLRRPSAMPARKKTTTLLKLAVTAVLLWLLYRKVDFDAFAKIFANADGRWIPAYFAIAFLNMYLSSLRWRLFLRADGIEVPVRQLFASHWIASFCNFFLPSTVGGDVYRVADVGAKSGSVARGGASVFMDRLCGFLAMSFLGFLFPLAGLRHVPRERWPWLLVPVAFFVAFAAVFVLFVRGQGLLRRLVRLAPAPVRGRIEGFTGKFLDSVAAGAARPAVVARAVAISLVFQMFVFTAIAVTGRVLRFPVPFAWYCVFAPLVCILEALPVSINGMGLREAAYAAFFGIAFPLVGFEPPEGLDGPTFARTCAGAMALCYMALTLAYALGGGFLLLLRMYAPRRGGRRPVPAGETAAGDKQ